MGVGLVVVLRTAETFLRFLMSTHECELHAVMP